LRKERKVRVGTGEGDRVKRRGTRLQPDRRATAEGPARLARTMGTVVRMAREGTKKDSMRTSSSKVDPDLSEISRGLSGGN
jgi:hypothetical protein